MTRKSRRLAVTVTNAVAGGDQIAVEYACELERRDGAVERAHGCNVFTIRRGRIHRLRSYYVPDAPAGGQA